MGEQVGAELFAAYHVFHRLPVPRHPPCALYSLTIIDLRFVSGSFESLLMILYWRRYGKAGGCRNFKDNIWRKPIIII